MRCRLASPTRTCFPSAIAPWRPACLHLAGSARPATVADVAVFLASDEARWLTGENIQAGGGVA
ncbi:SDR family oxidoreductase [Mesorhizobium sp. LSJC265A00]|uniref:SDR family oxidoreductase n=1 Tax=Mesorhizobium sp. LSJC265A00 TaxID=1287322 RepID=UPI004037A3C3